MAERKIRQINNNSNQEQKPLFEPTPDSAFQSEIDIAGDESSKRLVQFVEEQIDRMNNKILFDGTREPSLYELDMALSTYEQTLFGLIALYESNKMEAELARERYNEFYNNKYMEVRNTYNNASVKNAQWLSAKEIEATTYSVFKRELAELKADQIEKDCRRSTAERLMKGWESYLWVLNTLSKNSQAEMNANLKSVDLYRGDEPELRGEG